MIVKINGRSRFFRRIDSVKRVGRGKYEVSTSYGSFRIEGGRSIGGSRRDWFLESDRFADGKPIFCTSVIDALNCIEGM